MKKVEFKKAKLVWIQGECRSMNVTAEFLFEFDTKTEKQYKICLAASTLYACELNEVFIGYGPARSGHTEAKVDSYVLPVKAGKNILKVTVAGYHCNSYYTIRRESFFIAELYEDEQLLSCTDKNIKCFRVKSRIQKVPRFSFQRAFTECYDLALALEKVEVEELHLDLLFMERDVPYPEYQCVPISQLIESGIMISQKQEENRWFFFVESVNERAKGVKVTEDYLAATVVDGFYPEELKMNAYQDFQGMDFMAHEGNKEEIAAKEYALYRLPHNNTGFIESTLEAIEDSEVLLVFDELLVDGKISVKRWGGQINAVKYHFPRGSHRVRTMECYGFQYLAVIVLNGKVKVDQLTLREYVYPYCQEGNIETSDEKLIVIFEAARETFRQCTIDALIDCPQRERGSWLFDSYWAAQSEKFFSGHTYVQKAMYENINRTSKVPAIPEEAIPMCYPADHYDGIFIPQFGLWYMSQLEQYFKMDPDADPEDFRKRCLNFMAYMARYENSLGLLEAVPGWSFIEWSKANDWVGHINFPTNMIYARSLDACAGMFGMPQMQEKAKKIRELIRQYSFDGKIFLDHAMFINETVRVFPDDASEICQYYAVYTGVADLKEPKYGYLKDLILNIFSADRKEKQIFPEIAYSNMLGGTILRMEILLKMGFYEKLLDEIRDYCYPMAVATGTLWEHNDDISGSLNHGFTSFVGVLIAECLKKLKTEVK